MLMLSGYAQHLEAVDNEDYISLSKCDSICLHEFYLSVVRHGLENIRSVIVLLYLYSFYKSKRRIN